MDPVSILTTVIGLVVSLQTTVNDALAQYQQVADQKKRAFSTLKAIKVECEATDALATSTKALVERNSGQKSGKQKRLIDVLGTNAEALKPLIASLNTSIQLILGHKGPSKIRTAFAKKEAQLTGKLEQIKEKRELVHQLSQALTSGNISDIMELINASHGNTTVQKIDGKGRELMEELAGDQRPAVIQRLLEEGADANYLTIDFDRHPPDHPKVVTPLLYAVRGPTKSSCEAVDILLSRGALPNLVVGDEPPLWQAFASGNIKLATRLLDAGADVQYPCVKGAGRSLLGTTIFSESFADQKLEFVELALMYGADRDTKAPNGNTPLHDAVELVRGEDTVDALLRGCATVDARGRDDLTPLMMAAQRGDQAVTDLLVENGAAPWLLSKDGLTAAEYARREGHKDLADGLDTFIE
ncbi:ankyrin repeat-containing domain protein [Aspergillus karnatakaensis]|uniref:ankyrin repeat-containing domain protein n=1 Tax=Aspergillus karnatakaensis TaxID=1810916 RepID=UPI003CCD38C3